MQGRSREDPGPMQVRPRGGARACRVIGHGSTGRSTSQLETETSTDSVCRRWKSLAPSERFFQHS
jgi:hypothetical protein